MSSLESLPSTTDDARTARLRAYGVLDGAPFPALDELAKRAQEVAGFPIAWLSFFDGRSEHLKARCGVSFTELPCEKSLAFGFAALADATFVEDATRMEWRAHPLVAGGPRVRFVGIVPLVCPDGLVVGTLTVADRVPRRLRPAERTALEQYLAR